MTRSRLILATALATTALTLAACGDGGDPLAVPEAPPAPTDTIVVGSADFAENALLAQIYAGALEAKGVEVTERLNIGSRETYLPGLLDGSIDLIPEYSGVLLQYFAANSTQVTSAEVYTALVSAVPAELSVLEPAAAENKDAVVVTRQTADRYALTSIADLAAVEAEITFGGPPEFQTRPTGLPGMKRLYDLDLAEFRSLDAGGPLTINALKNGQVQAANVFTTDPNIPLNDWVILEDPKNLFAAQNVLPLITKAKATPTVTAALNAVSATLTTEVLADLDKQVLIDQKDPATVAEEFLTAQGLN